jgi:hypothetical protein
MLRIDKGNPWIMWPDGIVENFIENPANKVFDYNGNFTFKLAFSLPSPITEKSTLFSKLPSYFGIDLEENGLTLIVTYDYKESNYLFINYKWETSKSYELVMIKEDNILNVLVNQENLLTFTLKGELASDSTSHIIFGAGNFPKNNFNLNYLEVELEKLQVFQENALISEHDFDVFIHNKSLDKTGNCNFIHKI